jgi:hypothetical protein
MNRAVEMHNDDDHGTNRGEHKREDAARAHLAIIYLL